MRKWKWIGGMLAGTALAVAVGCITDPGQALLGFSDKDAAAVTAKVDAGLGNGNDNGPANGNDNAGNGNDNGPANMNDNGAGNGNDNGPANGNDNGPANGNDNAGNMNDNGGNGNDNGGDLGACCLPDGTCFVGTSTECASAGTLGDMNCDGVVSVGDINPFVLALTQPDAYDLMFPDCDLARADINGDGMVSVGDINGFVDLVSNGTGGVWLGTGSSCRDCGGGNGNDNGGNGNDNGAGNMNDNGGNGNDNGGNGNDNGNGGVCLDGSVRLRVELAFDSRVEYSVTADGCEYFRARVRDWPQSFVTVDVTIEGIVVGQIFVDDRGRGEIEFDASIGTFPPDFPQVFEGDIADIGGRTSGALALDCSANICNGNFNGGNGNDNGAGNMNDNAANGNDNGPANGNDNGVMNGNANF